MKEEQAGVIDKAYVNKLLEEVKRLERVRVSQADAIGMLQKQIRDQELQLATLRPPEQKKSLPFPERFMVGMKFRRADGFIATCVDTFGDDGCINTPPGEIPPSRPTAHARGSWLYRAGHNTMSAAAFFPQSELVEYLGKE